MEFRNKTAHAAERRHTGEQSMDKKKIKYIRIKEEPVRKPSGKKKTSRALRNFGHAMTIVGTTFSAMLLVLVIMVCNRTS